MNPDQTARMRRLVWIHAGRKHTMLVLSWRGSFIIVSACLKFLELFIAVLTHYFMSILWKMAVFIEKSPVTSSNCYNTIKTASTLIKLGTNVDWTIALATTCSGLNFLLPWQRGDISKLPKITILRWFFPSKLISKCCNFSMDWDRVKGFSALVTRYLMINLGSF